jgi:three-Cys-motif partner protein
LSEETPLADEHHSWEIGRPPPVIRPHSVAKHRIIAKYLARYIDTLTSNPRIPALKLTLIDGFAGGGLYLNEHTKEEHFGSPLLMLKTIQESAAIVQARRSRSFDLDVEYLFVESSLNHIACLKVNLEKSDFKGLLGDGKIELLNDLFVNQVDAIIKHVQNRRRGNRAIFVLDQFGYKDVPFPAIQRIMSSLTKAEVILTFASDSLISYISDQDQMQRTLERVGLRLSKEQIRSAKDENNWRLAIQLLLHEQIFQNSGARHYTPFFIRSKDSHRDYWLIHLSNHWRARDVMVGLHWDENTSFAHYGSSGLTMLGYDLDDDIEITSQPFLFDQQAKTLTTEALLDELPKRIDAFGGNGVSFDQFFKSVTNHSPATSIIVKQSLAILRREDEIEIRDQTGLTKRPSIQNKTDILRATGRPSLFRMNG